MKYKSRSCCNMNDMMEIQTTAKHEKIWYRVLMKIDGMIPNICSGLSKSYNCFNRGYNPVWRERKSGKPEETEMPAPTIKDIIEIGFQNHTSEIRFMSSHINIQTIIHTCHSHRISTYTNIFFYLLIQQFFGSHLV